jgi:hypothetical protein
VHCWTFCLQDVENVKHLAELGVVFLLFNIGLELSLDRLQSMAKYVFGMGSMQVRRGGEGGDGEGGVGLLKELVRAWQCPSLMK